MPALTPRVFGLALLASVPLGLTLEASAQSRLMNTAPPHAVRDDTTSQPRIVRVPDGAPGRILKFEFCEPGKCDRNERQHWTAHYLEPPPGEVCRLSDVGEALKWLTENRPGALLAGWGCVSVRDQSA